MSPAPVTTCSVRTDSTTVADDVGIGVETEDGVGTGVADLETDSGSSSVALSFSVTSADMEHDAAGSSLALSVVRDAVNRNSGMQFLLRGKIPVHSNPVTPLSIVAEVIYAVLKRLATS